MMNTPPPRAAAWAPWLDGQRDWLIRRETLAASWLTQRATTEKSRLIVQGTSHADHYRDGTSPSAAIARRGSVATYRSPVRDGATYADNVDIRLLATAMSTADGNSLAATESPTFPLVGWAMAVSAINLADGQVTEDERTPEQIEMLEHFVDQLYNGWNHREVGRRAAAYYLPRLVESGMSYPVFVGSVIALDPHHLDSNSDIDLMHKLIPPTWAIERQALSTAWRRRPS